MYVCYVCIVCMYTARVSYVMCVCMCVCMCDMYVTWVLQICMLSSLRYVCALCTLFMLCR